MSAASPVPFANNWAYLKTELSWLERLLMLAIARQRKEVKEIGRVARTKADRVSSHWWQGLISVSASAYDEGPPPKKQNAQEKSLGYQQQMDIRTQASAEKDICLALPSLKKALHLSLFEKNVILLALAPEVDVRYGRLYHFLQTGEESVIGELPTVDLALRLLCRNERERRQARDLLTGPNSLIQRKVLQLVTPTARTLLSSYLQVTDEWVNYFLADHPNPKHSPVAQRLLVSQSVLPDRAGDELAGLNRPALKDSSPPALALLSRSVTWDQLVLPLPLKQQLQTLSQQVLAHRDVETPGQRVLLIGEPGTGKTTAAVAIATILQMPLFQIDLAEVPPSDWLTLMTHLQQQPYPIILIQSAQKWFGRHGLLDGAALHRWFHQPASQLILFETHYRHTIRATWRQRMDLILDLPLPSATHRQQLWQQVLPEFMESMTSADWIALSRAFKLTGAQINQIADIALALAKAKGLLQVERVHLQQALMQYGHTWQPKGC